jgi:DNA-binding PadR family transcriptional regulator
VEIGTAAGLPSGTVHPILARLETMGWLTSRWEDIDPRAEGRPVRRYYQLTPDGMELARAALARATAPPPGPPGCDPSGRSHDRPHGVRGAGQAGRPKWWASLAVRSASLPLPSEDRWRYRQEFLAALYGMTPAEQLHHATGVLSRGWALRVALTEPDRLTRKVGGY